MITKIKYFNQEKNIKIIYKTQSINNFYYKCQKRPKCPGRRKLSLIDEKFSVIKDCDYNINHDTITYEEFKEIFEKNKLKTINLENNKIL